MHEIGILRELVIAYAVAGVVVFVFHRLRAPSLVGLLLAGVVVGPFGMGFVSSIEEVQTLAEIGVVILLFTVGLELSLAKVFSLLRLMLSVGIPQVLGAALVTIVATVSHLETWSSAIFAGMLVAMSSTAVVMRLLSDRGEIDAPYGRVVVAVLLLQDLLVTACMLSLPLLSSQQSAEGNLFLQLAIGGVVVMGVVTVIRFAFPPLIYEVLRTGNRELFMIAILVVVIGSAGLTAWSGLSFALGAFLAGLALSDSEYAHHTLAEVLPFRDALSSLFFVSVGMLLDVGFVRDHVGLIMLTVASLVVLKFGIVAGPLYLLGYPLRTTLLSGLALAQVGEFSFVLASRGVQEFSLLSRDDYQIFLASAVITMALTPLLVQFGHRMAHWAEPRWNQANMDLSEEEVAHCHDHVIIAGFGLNGQNLAHVLRSLELPYVVIEMNPRTVRQKKAKGEPIMLGDGSRESILDHCGIKRARAMVVVISDPVITRRMVQVARRLNPSLTIVVRTRYVSQVEELRRLGATEIIPEEFETSVEIFARVLEKFLIPRNLILDLIDRVRRDHYQILREQRNTASRLDLPMDMLAEVTTVTCLIRAETPAVGRSLRDLDLRRQTGATVIAVRRAGKLIPNPEGSFVFESDDILMLVGDSSQLDRAITFLDPRIDSVETTDGRES